MKTKNFALVNIQELVEGYDGVMFNPNIYEYLDHSDFLNYGYWTKQPQPENGLGKLIEKLLSLIPYKQGKILDVACGKGASSHYIMNRYHPEELFGINISTKQLASAQKNAPNCTFLQMNATQLDFIENSFDIVICVEAAFHFDTREQFFNESCRVLKPGGHLVLSDILMTRQAEQNRAFRTEKNYVADLDEYSKILERSGFENIQVVNVTKNVGKAIIGGVVHHFHEKFFNKEISLTQLSNALARTHRVAPDIMHYILVKANKPGAK